MANEILIAEFFIGVGFGALGGLVRILVEGMKNWSLGRFSWRGFLIYSFALLIIGAFSGLMLGFSKLLGFLGGYAGIDLMDGFYTAFKKKKIKFK